MSRLLCSVIAAGLASVSMADALIGTSKPFSVNTMIGDFKIVDVKSDYCSGAYGKSGKQTFLSGVNCEIEFTVSATSFYDVDYVTVNGEIHKYPKFKYNVGKLGSGGAMNVVAVSTNGDKTEPFRVNLDVAKPHETMVKPAVVERKSKEVVYGSLYNGLKVVDSDRFFKLASSKKKSPFRDTPLLFMFESDTGVVMSSTFSSKQGICELSGSAKTVKKPIGKVATAAANVAIDIAGELDGRAKILKCEVTGAQQWKWNGTAKRYDKYSSQQLGLKIPLSHTFKESYIWGLLFWKVGLTGSIELKAVQYLNKAENGWRFEYAGKPSAYAGLGVGISDVLASGVRLKGNLSIKGGAPANPRFIDEIELSLSVSGTVEHLFDNAAGEQETDWFEWAPDWLKGSWDLKETLSSRGGALSRGLAMSSMSGANPQGAGTSLSGALDAPQRFSPAVAVVGETDVLAYHEEAPDRAGPNVGRLMVKTGTSDDWDEPEVVWDDGTADGVASIGSSEGGDVVLAWENGRGVLDEHASRVAALGNFEIAVAVRGPNARQWSAKNLTNDDRYNHMPRVLAPRSGTGYLVFWLSTDVEDALDEFTKPSRLMCARHVGNDVWRVREIARTASLPLVSYDATCGDDGLIELLFSECDYEAGVQRTYHVKESGAVDASGFGSISSSVVGEKGLGVMPQFVDANSGSRIAWVEDGRLHVSASVSFEDPIVVDTGTDSIPSAFAAVNGFGETALVWTELDAVDPAHPSHAYALMYDSSEGRWGYPLRITDDERDESEVKAAIGADKAIRMACCATEVSTNETGEVVFGGSSLETYYSPTVCELVVDEECFELPAGELTIDKSYEVLTTIRNIGRRGSNGPVDVLVSLIEDGEETSLAGDEYSPFAQVSFAGGETVVLTNVVEFCCAATGSRELFAMVDPEYMRRDEDGLYLDWCDSVWLNVGRPRLGLVHVDAQYDDNTNCFLTATLKNAGTLPYPAGAKVLFRRGTSEGPIIGEDTLPAVFPGEMGEYSAGIAWDMSKDTFSSASETVYAVLDLSDVEFDDECDGDASCTAGSSEASASVDVVTPMDADGNGVWDGEEQMLAVPGIYEIAYSLGGGTNAASNPESYAENDLPLSLAAPVRDGYTFVGWVQGTGVIERGTSGDLLFTAVWEKTGALPSFEIEDGVLKGAALNGVACITIPSGVESIAPEAFANAVDLFRVTIPNSVTNIGTRAFDGVAEVLFADRTAPLWIADSAIAPAQAAKVLPRGGGLSFVGWMDEVEMFLSNPFGQSGGSRVSPVWTTVPENDGYSAAPRLQGAMGTVVCNNVGATREPDEPLIAGDSTATASVWWIWKAPQSGQFRFFTSGSRLDTVVGVYRGASLSELDVVAENDDAEGVRDGSSSAVFAADSGTEYYIAVAGKDGGTGILMLNWEPLDSYVWKCRQVEDGGVEITGVVPQPEGVLLIPDHVDGLQVTRIAGKAFEGCSEVKGVKIPGSVNVVCYEAFRGCQNLETVELSSGVESIENHGFSGCTALTQVIMPNSVTNIGPSAFCGCSNLADIAIPDSVKTIGEGAFDDCAESLYDTAAIPGVTMVDGWAVAFDEEAPPSSLDTTGMRGIADRAFYQCFGLTGLTIGDGVRHVGEMAFEGCINLESVSISKDVIGFGRQAFSRCGKLLSFSVDDANEHYASIEGMLCDKQGELLVCCPGGAVSVAIPPSIKTIGESSFCECASLQEVSIHDGVLDIGNWAFEDCDALAKVAIGNGVLRIGNGAFDGCMALAEVVIPDGVTGIGSYAFGSCSALKSVVVGKSVRNIDYGAFAYCGNLVDIVFKGNAPRLNESYYSGDVNYAFTGVGQGCVVRVPRDSTGWGVSIPGQWNGMRIEYSSMSLTDRQISIVALREQTGAKGVVSMSPKNGVVKAGGTATLTAKAKNKNTAFAYWTDGNGNIVGYSATLKVKPDADATYNAVFRLKSKCVRPVLPSDDIFYYGYSSDNSMVGVAYKAQVVVDEAAYPVRFSAKNLPKGLKIDAVTGVISGVPTKAGTFKPIITVKSAANTKLAASSRRVVMKIAKLPVWARGSFSGPMYLAGDYDEVPAGQATLSVGSTGKISGKFAVHGTNWTFSVSSYSAASASDGGLLVASGTATRKVGKTTYKQPWRWRLDAPEEDVDRFSLGDLDNGRCEFFVVRNNWKDSRPAAVLGDWAGVYDWLAPDGAKLALTVGGGGIVRVAGTLGNGRKLSISTPLLMEFEDIERVLIYAPPAKVTKKDKKGKIVSSVSYPEFVAYVRLHNEPGVAAPGGEFAYRRQGVRPEMLSLYGEPSGTGAFKYSPAYGQAASNATVTVTAVPAKDSVFAYWMLGDDIVGYGASYKVRMGDGDFTGLSAVFRKKSVFVTKPDRPFIAMKAGEEVEEESPFDSLRVGVAFRAEIDVDPDSRPVRFQGTNLPAGLKVNATTGVISGVPTASGMKEASFKAVCAANTKLVSPALKVSMVVAKLDAWARGTYAGKGTLAGKVATFTMTVGTTGKISGKFTIAKKAYSFNAGSYASYEDGVYVVMAKVKYGTVTYPLVISVGKDSVANKGMAYVEAIDGAEIAGSVKAVRK